MGKKKKYIMEFGVKASPAILYNYLITPSGLSQWFCDDVNLKDRTTYVFIWGNSEQAAKMVKNTANKNVKFKWDESEEEEYFEFDIQQDELTNDVALVITDFAEERDITDNRKLWESQVDTLKHNIGS